MKLSKLIGISSLTCLSISAFASASAFASTQGKYYVAADAGIFQGTFNNKYLDQFDTIPLNISQTSNQNGYTGGIAIGYSKLLCPKYFIGGEVSANKDGSSASFQSGATSSVFSDQVQMKGHLDLILIPGLMLSDSIAAYLKLGLSYAFLDDSLTSPVGTTATITQYSNHNNAFGLAAGLGVAKAISEQVDIFTEANYHDYGSVNFSKFHNYEAVYTHSSHIYSYEVVIGAAYTLA